MNFHIDNLHKKGIIVSRVEGSLNHFSFSGLAAGTGVNIMTSLQYQDLVEQIAKSQFCIDLLSLPVGELISRVEHFDALGEAVAKAAYQQITRNFQA